MKKSYKIFLTIISVLLLPGLITGCKKLDYNGDENNYNVYLYGKWDNDISVLKNEDIIYLVYRDEKIEGFLSFKIHYYLHHDHDTGEIVELVILPEKRSLKIGKQLIEKIEEIAKDKQLEQIELSTSIYRKDAHRFYERQGYEKLHYNYTKELDD